MQDCHCVELMYAPATGHIALFNNIFKLLILIFLHHYLHIPESAILAC